MFMILRNKNLLYLLVVLLIASFLRFYQLGVVPPAISWDEAAVGYNAWTIVHYGKDEWGNLFPLVFKSFEDDKHPIHFYLTAPFVAVFGLTDFAVRFAPALFGVLNVLLIFLIGKDVFKDKRIGFAGALLMAISPYAIQFSRFNHEANFALFFFMLGFWWFFKSLNGMSKYLPLATISFGISILVYHASLVVVPPAMFLLAFIYKKEILYSQKNVIFSLAIILTTSLLYVIQPSLLGLARMKQTSIAEDVISNTRLFKQTNNYFLGRLEVTYDRYLAHFSPTYLFISGDRNPKFSTQKYGQFYQIEALFLVAGFVWILKNRKREYLLLLFWALIAPLHASLSGGTDEVPHAARALFTMGSWHLIEAIGLVGVMGLFKNTRVKLLVAVAVTLTMAYLTTIYFKSYLTAYPKQYGIDWQYGMKQIAEHIKDNPEYSTVFVTDARSQPYIFLLYYLKIPLPEFLKTVEYNQTDQRSSNLVSSFSKFNFGNWDAIESDPQPGLLYVLTPSQYDGLRQKSLFQIKELISYPNGTDAFYLVSLY